jgi:hypothetical protein
MLGLQVDILDRLIPKVDSRGAKWIDSALSCSQAEQRLRVSVGRLRTRIRDHGTAGAQGPGRFGLTSLRSRGANLLFA